MTSQPKGSRGQSTRPTKVNKHPLTPEVLQDIGRILVATSDLDDLLSLLIFQFSKFVDPQNGYIVLGRLPVSEKVKRAEILVKRYADGNFQSLFADLKVSLSNIFRYRNAFAHGVYQGIDESDGSLIFTLTAEDYWDPDRGFDGNVGVGILPNDLNFMATEAEKLVLSLESWWKLNDWRATRFPQHFQVIPRGQRPRRR
jgi:hypothetical protein